MAGDQRDVEITLKTIGPARPTSIRVSSPIKVCDLRRLVAAARRLPADRLKLVLRGKTLHDKNGNEDALIRLEDGDSLMVAVMPKPPAEHLHEGSDDEEEELVPCHSVPVLGMLGTHQHDSILCTDAEKIESAVVFFTSHSWARMLSLRYSPSLMAGRSELNNVSQKPNGIVVPVCGARGPRPRFPRVWKSRKRIGTISKSQKLVECVKGLSNVKEEVYGALDSFIAWDLEFPLIAVKKALKTLEIEKEWKRIIQVIKWMFSKGQGKTMGSYYTLLNALAEDGRLEEAEELYMKIFSQYLESLPRVFFMKMITLYYNRGMHEKMFEIFADMEELGIRPDGSIVRMLGDVFQKLGMMDKHDKLKKKYPPPTWEYRYIKGKRVRIRVYRPDRSKEEACTSLDNK
ncbi:putative pentatricopeptide repeat-containing protein [Cocos nucifera]|uniref:Putative pentatricopeptide repeat-containing protein n=1 Tax=Cocos nucifera TaxID=13894 RepID=A0A8K0IHS6_COCNU|nr:putative pentatricopeptide repeat-containing protein [Cocos nucifera]